MVNTSVFEAYNRGITDIFHVGDITDGDYSRIRPIHNYEVFCMVQLDNLSTL